MAMKQYEESPFRYELQKMYIIIKHLQQLEFRLTQFLHPILA